MILGRYSDDSPDYFLLFGIGRRVFALVIPTFDCRAFNGNWQLLRVDLLNMHTGGGERGETIFNLIPHNRIILMARAILISKRGLFDAVTMPRASI